MADTNNIKEVNDRVFMRQKPNRREVTTYVHEYVEGAMQQFTDEVLTKRIDAASRSTLRLVMDVLVNCGVVDKSALDAYFTKLQNVIKKAEETGNPRSDAPNAKSEPDNFYE